MGLMERFFPGRGTAVIERPREQSAYMRGNTGPVFSEYNPALRAASDDVRVAWSHATARAVDQMQNSGFIAGIVDQAVALTVGEGLKLNYIPDAAALGMTQDEVSSHARRVEARFDAYCSRPIDCDAEARKSFGHLQATAFRQWFGFGEIFATLPWRLRPGSTFGTKVKLVPGHMMSNKSDGQDLIHGVRVDSLMAPMAYQVKQKRKYGFEEEIEVPARDRLGRPLMIHSFDGMAGQVRGISPFTPVLKVCRQFDRLSDATLSAAILQAIYAAVYESEAPTMEALRALQSPQEQAAGGTQSLLDMWFEAKTGWHQNTNIDLGLTGRIAHAFPGEKLHFMQSQHPNDNFVDFADYLTYEMCRCAGLTHASGTGNYRNATYSSVRMATTDIFFVTLYRRKNIVAPFCQPVFEAFLEEDIDSGNTPFPGGIYGFYEKRAAATRSIWRGSGKPQADDLKTAKAHQIYQLMGVMSDEMICAELGVDYDDVVEARAREKALRAKYGLPEPVQPKVIGADDDEAKEAA